MPLRSRQYLSQEQPSIVFNGSIGGRGFTEVAYGFRLGVSVLSVNAIRLSIDSLIVSNDFLIASADSLMLLTHVPTDTGVLFQGKAKNVGVMVELTVL